MTQAIIRMSKLAVLVAALSVTACDSSKSQDSATAAPSSAAELRGGPIATRAPATPIPSSEWLRLRVGVKVYVGDDGADMTTQTICSTLAAYLATINNKDAAQCLHVKRGSPAIVETIIPSKSSDADAAFGAPHVQIRSADGSWAGFTSALLLQPVIPLGTTIVMQTLSDDVKVNLAPRQDSEIDSGPTLDRDVTVKLLRYYPDTGDRPLYVTVLDGEHAGQKGWIDALSGKTTDGVSISVLDFDVATPEPTTDPMQRTYTLTSKLRVFSDIRTCEDAFNAMHDDAAYQRLKDAVAAGSYHNFDAGATLHILSDPDPSQLWVIVGDDDGNQGCASRYNLPGY
jgi:hypothetical protein